MSVKQNQRVSQQDVGLVLGDRMNWSFALMTGVLNLFSAIIKVEGEQSKQEVKEAALAVFNSIPTPWVVSDPKFREDLIKCFDTVDVDLRKTYCGFKVGKPNIEKQKQLNPWRLYHTCVDVFHRRNLLNKPIFTEAMTGRSYLQKQKKKKTDKND